LFGGAVERITLHLGTIQQILEGDSGVLSVQVCKENPKIL
ncbi:unnamed protein product, partial [marine sediment metagenome]